MALRLKGSTSGYVEIDAPAVAGDNSITLPTTAGEITVKDASGNTSVGDGVNFGNPGTNIFTINTGGSERLRIGADGAVSIGGTLTYEDVTSVDAIGLSTFRDGLNTKDVGITTISSTNVNNSGTAVDVFIYDTSKDSDGGEWRKRTSHTSWYNETLNTSTRGSRREFPAVAVIVSESDTLTIYDGDDPDLPMWMKFTTTGSVAANAIVRNSGYDISTVSMLNGLLVGGVNFNGGFEINFVSDKCHRRNPSVYAFGGNVASRNGGISFITLNTTAVIVNTIVNDVAMTVLPNAPIDSATGLPVPTIAVATDGGVSVIKDDGTVVDIIDSNSGYRKNLQVKFTTDNKVVYTETSAASEYGWMYIHEIPSSDETITINTKDTALGWYDTRTQPYMQNIIGVTIDASINVDRNVGLNVGVGTIIPNIVTGNNHIFVAPAENSGITIIEENRSSTNSGLVAYATTSYNTGWMHGDIKGAFLSEKTTGTLSTTDLELITNGDFSNGTTGWSNDATPTFTVSGGVASVDRNGGSATGQCYQTITTEVGRTYTVSVLVSAISNGFQVYKDESSDEMSQSAVNTTGTHYWSFTATSTSTRLDFSAVQSGTATASFDNITIFDGVADRSVNKKALTVYGTGLTRSVVATGADLVAYSGFSNSDYLVQPYNSDMQTGTGAFSATLWFKTTSTEENYEGLLYYNRSGSIGYGWQIMMAPNSSQKGLYFYVYGASAHINTTAVDGLNDGVWHQVVVTHNNGFIQMFVDGTLRQSKSNPSAGSINDSQAKLHIGRWYGNANTSDYWWRGSIALARHSASVPSEEQIKKIYEDEKVLFQENAKATLYGSSDAVTALAYDEITDQLHVGTSSGRSDFQGLRRINNTTDPVSTAISAHDTFIIEQ